MPTDDPIPSRENAIRTPRNADVIIPVTPLIGFVLFNSIKINIIKNQILNEKRKIQTPTNIKNDLILFIFFN
jgi:hypothetical protein